MDEDEKLRSEMDEGVDIPNTFRILIATDNHLGYMERDPVRGNDSFVTFEEILQKAKSLRVDFVLLAGDLFHENKPSRSTIYRTMQLLRQYCFGDRPVNIEILSDQTLNFANKCVNYEDPNFNIEIPVFSIHGNHDDPAGDGGLAALDLLSVCNLVNYFGKSDNIDDITVYPILMRKGKTKIAIYGLGNIRDERLYRTFQQKKVKLMRPVESRNEWFNLLVLHQNRVAHTTKNSIQEVMLDNFLDFVVWGHEHECLISPQASTVGEFYITQPGSSVATALSDGESKKKKIGLLEICGDQFRLKALNLATVRPFVIEEVVLASEELDPHDNEAIIEFLASKVNDMIKKAEEERLERRSPKTPTKPLIRLKVDYTGFPTINPQRFGQRFVGRVANPNEILLLSRKKKTSTHSSKHSKEVEQDFLMKQIRPDPIDNIRIEDLIESFLTESTTPVEILPESDFNQALHSFVEKDDKDALTDFISKTLKVTQSYLRKEDPKNTLEGETIQAIVAEKTALKRTQEARENGKITKSEEEGLDDNSVLPKPRAISNESDHGSEGEDQDDDAPPPTKKSKTVKKATTEKKTTTKKKKDEETILDQDEDEGVLKKKPRQRKSTATTPSAKSTKSSKQSNYSLQITTTTGDDSSSSSVSKKSITNKKATQIKPDPEFEMKNIDESEVQNSQHEKKRRITSIADFFPSFDVDGEPSTKKSKGDDDEDEGVQTANWGKRKN